MIEVNKACTTDAAMAKSHGVPKFARVFLYDSSVITDAGLAHLGQLKNIRKLDLRGTRITDAGLEHLSGLTELLELVLAKTETTDAGLAHFHGMKYLRVLDLRGTRVSDRGINSLKEILPNLVVIAPHREVRMMASLQIA